MMEDGYYPVFEQTHIQFGMDDNIAVVEYEEGILSVRLFFSIDEEAYDLFLEACNIHGETSASGRHEEPDVQLRDDVRQSARIPQVLPTGRGAAERGPDHP